MSHRTRSTRRFWMRQVRRSCLEVGKLGVSCQGYVPLLGSAGAHDALSIVSFCADRIRPHESPTAGPGHRQVGRSIQGAGLRRAESSPRNSRTVSGTDGPSMVSGASVRAFGPTVVFASSGPLYAGFLFGRTGLGLASEPLQLADAGSLPIGFGCEPPGPALALASRNIS